MLNTLLFVVIIGYVLASVLIAKAVHAKNKNDVKLSSLTPAFLCASLSLIFHWLYTVNISWSNNLLNFSLSSMTTLVSALLVSIYLLGCLGMRIRKLGILVFPFAAICLIFAFFWAYTGNSEPVYLDRKSNAFNLHILISLLAYSLLNIAVIQALIYAYQDRQFKNRTAATLLAALPPLQTMELLLFRLITVGFILLTLTLASGAVFSQEIFQQAFEFNHHTALAILGWVVFALLLFKRYKSGLRGSQAVIWTVSGFLLIQLGYFGTKFITESFNIQ